MNVPESFALADLLHFFPSFVEVTAVDQKLGAKGLHRFILFRSGTAIRHRTPWMREARAID